jgi:DNA (cytosine-5)-methyltransferase 1
MFKVVSLFSGCGGADQGIIGDFTFNKKKYERLPFELVYATDIDQKALNSHMKNFNCENVVCKDICETKSNEIPNCDIIVGGFAAVLIFSKICGKFLLLLKYGYSAMFSYLSICFN